MEERRVEDSPSLLRSAVGSLIKPSFDISTPAEYNALLNWLTETETLLIEDQITIHVCGGAWGRDGVNIRAEDRHRPLRVGSKFKRVSVIVELKQPNTQPALVVDDTMFQLIRGLVAGADSLYLSLSDSYVSEQTRTWIREFSGEDLRLILPRNRQPGVILPLEELLSTGSIQSTNLRSISLIGSDLRDCNGPMHSLLKSLESPSVNVVRLHIAENSARICMLHPLLLSPAASRLEELDLKDINLMENSRLSLIYHGIAQLIQRPDNNFRCFKCSIHRLLPEDRVPLSAAALELFQALSNPLCRLTKLKLELPQLDRDLGRALKVYLASSACRLLTHLTISTKTFDNQGLLLLIRGLTKQQTPYNLKSFVLCAPKSTMQTEGGSYLDGGAVALMRFMSQTRHMSELGRISLRVRLGKDCFESAAEMLRNPHIRIKELTLVHPDIDCPSHIHGGLDLIRAVRLSNLSTFQITSDRFEFAKEFNKGYVHVIHALTSVRYFPRLGVHAWCRIIPMQDLIGSISECLGWNLRALTVPILN